MTRDRRLRFDEGDDKAAVFSASAKVGSMAVVDLVTDGNLATAFCFFIAKPFRPITAPSGLFVLTPGLGARCVMRDCSPPPDEGDGEAAVLSTSAEFGSNIKGVLLPDSWCILPCCQC